VPDEPFSTTPPDRVSEIVSPSTAGVCVPARGCPVRVLETQRLALRTMSTDDANFILELLNDPSFLRYIGDRGVRTGADACEYVSKGPLASYERFGFGLYVVEVKDSGEPAGICGLLKRDVLEDVDIGFALLPQFRSRGYAFESATSVLRDARDRLGLKRVAAIVSPDNVASIGLLGKLGFRFERMVRMSADSPEISLFAREV
jgi:ribosomal-protein-alanine N-acetyltransferase